MNRYTPTHLVRSLLEGGAGTVSRTADSGAAASGLSVWTIDPRRILDAVAAPFYVTDAEGRLVYYNDAAAACWGRRPPLHESRWAGALALYLEDGTPLPFEETGLAQSLRHGVEMPGRKAIIERPDGGRTTYMPYPSLVRDEAGTVVGAVNLLLDVTELEAARSREHESAVAKARFLSAVSHEFRTPIHGILGFADLLAEVARSGKPLSAEHETWIAELQSAGHHLLDLVTDAIAFTQASLAEAKPASTRRSAPIGAIVADTIDLGAAAFAGRGLSLLNAGPSTDVIAALDPAAARQALISIAKEAARHMRTGSTARITWGPGPDSTAWIQVHCQGLSFPPGVRERLEQPFAGTDREGLSRGLEGAGLSVATAAALIRGHGGALSIEDDEDAIVFRLTVPALLEPEPEAPAALRSADPAPVPAPHPSLHLADVVAAANDMIVVTAADLDLPGPTIVYVNPAFLRTTGYKAEEVLGRTPRMLQGPGTDLSVLRAMRDALRAGREASATVLNYTKAGDPYWVDLRVVPMRNQRGETTHFAAIERVLPDGHHTGILHP